MTIQFLSGENWAFGFSARKMGRSFEVTRQLCCNWAAYARLREVIMVNDWDHDGSDLIDTTRPITEIAMGLEYSHCNYTLSAGYEWQNWGNYVDNTNGNAGVPTDVGFSGFVIGAAYSY